MEDLDDDLSPRSGERPRAAWMDAISAELRLILAECLSTIRQLEPNSDRVRKLTRAAGKIQASITLLEGGQLMDRDSDDDLENPRRDLPYCSIADCGLAAGAVVGGELLCATHASEAMTWRGPAGSGAQDCADGGNDIRA